MSSRRVIRLDSIRRANQSMIDGKRLEDYNLPESIKVQISNRHYSAEEINTSYAQTLVKSGK